MEMDADHMELFVKSAKKTFSTMLGLDVELNKLFVCVHENERFTGLSGIIGLSGDVQGVVIIRFPLKTALVVVSRLIGEEVTLINDDVTDAIGELTNIIAGSAKKDFTDLNISIGLPTVAEGSDYVLHLSKDTPTFCARMASDMGDFEINVNIKFSGSNIS
jgi:chemotaxis protein CheX